MHYVIVKFGWLHCKSPSHGARAGNAAEFLGQLGQPLQMCPHSVAQVLLVFVMMCVRGCRHLTCMRRAP